MKSSSARPKPSSIPSHDSDDNNVNKNDEQKVSIPIINPKEQASLLLFDLESYISRYCSETRIQRLLFIARRAPSKDLARSAFTLLQNDLMNNDNWRMYKKVFGDCPEVVVVGDDNKAGVGEEGMDDTAVGAMSLKESGENMTDGDMNDNKNKTYSDPSKLSFTYSPSFTETSISNSNLKLETLEANILSAQSCLDKERIRLAITAIGSYHLQTGDITEASRRYKAARVYCLQTSQLMEVSMVILACALDKGEYGAVKELVARFDQQVCLGGISSGDGGGMDWFGCYLQCALGLACLAEGQFQDAALAFGRVRVVENKQIWCMLSLEDLALYGGLLGLATMDRNAMSKSLDVESCRERLELIPPLRDATRHYVRAEYGACLNQLEELKGSWKLDLYLAKHADFLWTMVRDKCITQYFAPYTSVSLERMMESFGFFDSIEEMEDVVANLIERKKIVGARIHSVNKTLSSMSVKELERRERKAMMRKIGRMGDMLLREVEGTILRLACLENNICVTKGKRKDKGGWKMKRNIPSWREGDSPETSMLVDDSNMQECTSDSSDEDGYFYGKEEEDTAPSMMDIDDYGKSI